MQCTTEVVEMLSAQDEPVQSLYAVLQQVTDHWHKRGRRYEAATVLVILLLAKLAGERTLSGVAQWARLRAAWLCEKLPLRQLPCANTYAYICAHLDAVELNVHLSNHFARLGLPL